MRSPTFESGVSHLKEYMEAGPNSDLANALESYLHTLKNSGKFTWVGLFEEDGILGNPRLFICLTGEDHYSVYGRELRDPNLGLIRSKVTSFLSVEQVFYGPKKPQEVVGIFEARKRFSPGISNSKHLWASHLI